MKTRVLQACVSLCFILPGHLMAQETSFVRQIQQIGGVNVVSDISVSSDRGQVSSGLLTSDLSIFQLYTTHANAAGQSQLLKLDEKSVGTFLPQVDIHIVSEDPHLPVTTRADRPYGVTVSVSGMMDGEGVPDYAKYILVGSGCKLYSPATFSPTGEVAEYADAWVYRSNGTYVDSSVIQRLPGATMAVGAETYSAHILPGAAAEGSGQVANAEIVILPVASAAIEGIEAGKTYMSLPTDATVKLFHAYPRSTTHAQIYKGPQVLGTSGTSISGTTRSYNTVNPQDAVVPLGSLRNHVLEDGEYTIEVLTVTPFNNGAPERLTHVSFVINRTISVNAMTTTIE